MGSKSHPKMGFQKNNKKIPFSGPSNVAHVLQITAKSMKFRFWFWPPFGSHCGAVLGAQMEAKASKKALQKNIKKTMPKMSQHWSPNGVPKWSQNRQKGCLGITSAQGRSQAASRLPSRSILAVFWDDLRTIFDRFSSAFEVISRCVV